MTSLRETNRSVWLAAAPMVDYLPLRQDVATDVAVIGGGIAGLTTALLLQNAGLKVVVLEADRIGCGTTGGSTAKVTSLHGMIYSQLEKKFDLDAARVYASANRAGVDTVIALADEIERLGTDCQLQQRSAYTYTCETRVDEIRAEAEAAQRAGLPVRFTTETDLPFRVQAAVRLDDQAQFDPYRYCVGLARALVAGGGEVFERSRILKVTQDAQHDKCKLVTHEAEMTAEHVVVATLLPFLDRGGFFARTSPSRSYGIAVELDGPAPAGMYINIETPTRSVRSLADGRRIIVVGETHKVGHDADTRLRYAALEDWARQYFPVRTIEHRWSAQDYMSADSVPYIGRMPLGKGRVWTATGFSKWGLSMGTAAAMILTDLIQDRANEWAYFFDATRTNLLPSAKKVVSANLDVAKRFVGDRVRTLTVPALEDLAAGEGGIVDYRGERVAAYRDESGKVHACSPVCSHMGCYVQWNTAERSWDCPCHGSRFDYDGQVLDGPALYPLKPKAAE